MELGGSKRGARGGGTGLQSGGRGAEGSPGPPARCPWRAGSARTRPAAAGSAGTGCCGTGPCPAGGGAAGRSRQPPGKRVSDAAVPRLRVGAGAERGPGSGGGARGSPSGRAAAVRNGRLSGCPTVRLSDRGSDPGALGPDPAGAGCCCFPFPSLYRTAAGPGSPSRERSTTGQETLPLSPSPETACWGRCSVTLPKGM